MIMLRNVLCCALSLLSVGLWQAAAQVSQQPCTQDCDRAVSTKLLVPNFVDDQKKIWLFPTKLAKGHSWVPTLAIAGTTCALLAADPYEGKYFHTHSSFAGWNTQADRYATTTLEVAAPIALYGVGLWRKDTKMQTTALLSGEAVADTEILAVALKAITQRVRPSDIPPNGNYRNTFYGTKGSVFASSFPSGHAIAAFSIATVVAHRYRNHRWVPFVAYGAATAIGFSRLPLSAHFASDVFAGGALGYAVTRFAVLRY